MIVRKFLQWIRTAKPGERAEATGALARAYLYSDLSADDRMAAEGAMIMLLDDPSALVRRALAENLAGSAEAPASVVHALATDQPSDIAAIVLARSPLLIDAELVDIVATGGSEIQIAVAQRAPLACAVAAALAEVGCAEACLVMIENPDAALATLSLDRLVERFGHLAAVREALFARDDLPAATRQAVLVKLSDALAGFAASRRWLATDRARHMAKEMCEKATVALAAECPRGETQSLVRHLCATGQLTTGLVLRALLSGNVVFFEEALAELSDVPIARVRALVHDGGGTNFRAIFARAGLPPATYPAFWSAVEALREQRHLDEPANGTRLKRRMVERVLTSCANVLHDDVQPLLILLRRFATEAAREEARRYCDDLAMEDWVLEDHSGRQVAA